METQIDGKLVFWAITACFFLVILVVGGLLLFVFNKIPQQYGGTLRAVLDKTELLKLATIFIIIIASTYLSLVDALNDSVVAIFSGVAGYVLGTVGKDARIKNDEDFPSGPAD